MRPYRLVRPVLTFLATGCSANVAPSPTATMHPNANMRIGDAPAGWMALDADWTTPSCGDGCDPNCVEDGRYQVSKGVVHDQTQGLFWERNRGPQLVLGDAVDYCASLSLDGVGSDWRLPSYEELAGILYKAGGLRAGSAGSCIPAIDQAAFPASLIDYFWMNAEGSVRTPAIDFFDGREQRLFSDTPATFRCVHDPVKPQ